MASSRQRLRDLVEALDFSLREGCLVGGSSYTRLGLWAIDEVLCADIPARFGNSLVPKPFFWVARLR